MSEVFSLRGPILKSEKCQFSNGTSAALVSGACSAVASQQLRILYLRWAAASPLLPDAAATA